MGRLQADLNVWAVVRAIELFAGIGGFRLGLERAGHEVVYANEFDRFAADIYDKRFGGQIDRRDITTVDAGDIPAHDLLCGGFPCQAFSVAGLRRGFDETRGTLFFEIARILEAKRPPYLLLENVKGLLSHDSGRTFQTIIGVLTDLGYVVQWGVLNSKDYGVPQNRERIFIIGHLGTKPRPQVFSIGDRSGNAEAGDPEGQDSLASTVTTRTGRLNGRGTHISVVGNLYKGNSQRGRVYSSGGIAPTLAMAASGGNRNPVIEVERAPLRFLDRNQKNIKGDYSFTVDTSNTSGVKVNGRIRRLTPLECERLQGFPDGWTEGESDSQRYKQLGNAVTVNVVQFIGERLPR